ncbi:MAG: type I-E CRISPR-associated protein Cas6/Cse3/CasE [Methanomicrobiaceae archaeon]|nr:type I-E CRISPR-associated protein Cas6/Cse3/CasE [Methanomicrobiaceae archaeon]
MFLSRVTVNMHSVFSPEFQKIASGPYQIHSMLWDMFSDSEYRERDFLYRVDLKESKPVIFIVSERKPYCNGSLWNIETKSYNPVITEGKKLGFSLRANPIVTKTIPATKGQEKKRYKHDVVMDAKQRIIKEYGDKSPLPPVAEIVQQEGFRWLSSRSERLGFSIEDGFVRADAYNQVNFMQGKKNRKVSLSTIDFTGILTVKDSEKFIETLGKGVGPAKGFGCGLMLVRSV